ncbi:hypothetical protein Tco_1496765, partial [Tanacetum coccineum]
KLVDAILLRASAFLFLLYGTCLIEKLAKPLTRLLTFSRFSSGFSTRKSATICPFTDILGRYVILCSPSMTLHFCNLPATSRRDIIFLMGCAAYEVDWRLNRVSFSHQDRANCSMRGGQACSAFGVQWKSLFLMHFFKVLNSGKDFSADLERNLFRLANFPLRL